MTGVRVATDHALSGRVTEQTLKEFETLFPEDPNAYSPTGALDTKLQSGLTFLTRQREMLKNELAGKPGAPSTPPGATPGVSK